MTLVRGLGIKVVLAGLVLALALGMWAWWPPAGPEPAPEPALAPTGRLEISEAVRAILPRGTVLYYGKIRYEGWMRHRRWSVERLDVDTGRTWRLLSGDATGLSEMVTESLAPDGAHLLVSVRSRRSRRTNLVEVSTRTGEWRILMENAFGGAYAPDGRRLVVRYPVAPEDFSRDLRMRVRIIDRSGRPLRELPCASELCYHAHWSADGERIWYVEETPSEAKIQQYHVRREELVTLFTERRPAYKVSYPLECNGNVLFMQKLREARYSPETGLIWETRLLMLEGGRPGALRERDFYLYSSHACLRGIPDYLLTTRLGDRKNGVPTAMGHLRLFSLADGRSHIIGSRPGINKWYLGPIAWIPARRE